MKRKERGTVQKYSTESCLTSDDSNAKMCDSAKRRQREKMSATGFESNNCMHVCMRVTVQIFVSVCVCLCTK